MEHSGQWGVFNGVPAMRQWTLNEGYTQNARVHSGSAGMTDRTNGIYDWTGSVSGFGSSLPWNPGELVAATLFKGPDAAGDLTPGEDFEGELYIESAVINWNFESNEAINWSAEFGGNGALTPGTGNRPVDVAEVVHTPCAGKIVLVTDDGITETIIPHIKTATLTFTRPSITTVNSGTAAGAGKCLTKRGKGPALDWTLALVSDDANENAGIASGVTSIIRCYVTASTFYELKWGLFGQRSNLVVNPETGTFISQTYNAAMRSLKSGVVGDVLDPSAASMVV